MKRSSNINHFKDYYSAHSKDYANYRPDYPIELFQFLSDNTQHHDQALDCGTGNGQAAVLLSPFYHNVLATDASSKQISNAIKKDNITYLQTIAEKCPLGDHSIDLITVAQAFQWFDFDAFFNETNRTLKPNGLIAIWCYNLQEINPAIEKVIMKLYVDILGPYWPEERKYIVHGYSNIFFPFNMIKTPNFKIVKNWNFDQEIDYLSTWSAIQRFENEKNKNPLDLIYDDLLSAWGNKNKELKIIWPIKLLAGRKR